MFDFARLQETAVGRNMAGALAMLVSGLGYTVNDAFTKTVSDHLPTGEIIFVRGIFASAMIVAILVATGFYRRVRVPRSAAFATRIFGEVGATVLFLAALFHMPIAEATVILQIAPLAVTAASAVFLKEAVGWRRWTAVTIGFCGILLIVRPGFSGFDAWALVALAAVVFIVIRDLSTRLISADIPTLTITMMTTFTITVLGLAMGALETWVMPTAAEVFFLFAAAVFIIIGYFFIIVAMRVADIGFVSPFRYAIVLYAGILGYAIWGDVPDLPMVVGAAIVIATGIYTFHRERLVRRTDPEAAPSPRPPGAGPPLANG
ncbi:DMT family transporter [Rhodobium gokarnense]|uniref:Drug/metabolite transporter (DMT)-like permease n=1 Tax=Rhodobium gokarnense TaxID=364296 RepID=A0ABT3HGH2_9HYPH|nr:DMT family transporter [Rhodobium gokarnense]MCW2309498.1 drug/metabolite transporter (DMT)-like permease [Rhodobium gokarnense]